MGMLISMWAAVAFTIYWLEYFRGPHKFPALDFKPLNCECCLSVWSFVVFAIIELHLPGIIQYIAAAFTCGIVAPTLLKLIRK